MDYTEEMFQFPHVFESGFFPQLHIFSSNLKGKIIEASKGDQTIRPLHYLVKFMMFSYCFEGSGVNVSLGFFVCLFFIVDAVVVVFAFKPSNLVWDFSFPMQRLN